MCVLCFFLRFKERLLTNHTCHAGHTSLVVTAPRHIEPFPSFCRTSQPTKHRSQGLPFWASQGLPHPTGPCNDRAPPTAAVGVTFSTFRGDGTAAAAKRLHSRSWNVSGWADGQGLEKTIPVGEQSEETSPPVELQVFLNGWGWSEMLTCMRGE